MNNISLNKVKLSTTISYILRHNPGEFELELDEEGFVSIDSLIMKIIKKQHKYANVLNKKIIEEIVEEDEDARYEIRDNSIRAVYGHSIKGLNINRYLDSLPPKILYHGTTKENFEKIIESGFIKSMQRDNVCLSEIEDKAIRVALRRTNNPVILKIRALDLHNDLNQKFFKKSNIIWETSNIPVEYIVF